MKRTIFCVSTAIPLLLIVACSKSELEQSSGTKLVSIEYFHIDRSWDENYFYAEDKKLEKIEDFRSLGTRYEITRDNDKITAFSTYRMNDNKFLFRDSIVYNSNESIHSIYRFSANSGQNLPVHIYEFEYDDKDRVSKRSKYIVQTKKYQSIEKYFWSKKNIDRVEDCNGNEKVLFEFFYKYDNKENYKKGLPTSILDPISWANNNVVKMDWTDHIGILDLACQPCKTTYTYNLDNFPVEISTDTGREMKLTYE